MITIIDKEIKFDHGDVGKMNNFFRKIFPGFNYESIEINIVDKTILSATLVGKVI